MIIASATKVINEYDTMEAVDAANEAAASASKELVAMEHAAIDEETGSVSIFGKDPEGNITSEMELTSRSMNLYDAEDLVASFGGKSVSLAKDRIEIGEAELHYQEPQELVEPDDESSYSFHDYVSEGTVLNSLNEMLISSGRRTVSGGVRGINELGLRSWNNFSQTTLSARLNDGGDDRSTLKSSARFVLQSSLNWYDGTYTSRAFLSAKKIIFRALEGLTVIGPLTVGGHNSPIGTRLDGTIADTQATSTTTTKHTITLPEGVWILTVNICFGNKTTTTGSTSTAAGNRAVILSTSDASYTGAQVASSSYAEAGKSVRVQVTSHVVAESGGKTMNVRLYSTSNCATTLGYWSATRIA